MFPDYIDSPCRSNYSYFWSADYMRLAYHSTAIMTIPLSVLTFYVIWAITPSRMRNMKWPLIISHCWSVNLDLIFTILSAPLVFGPSAAGLPLGLLGDLGVPTKVQAYWGQVSLIMCGICFVMLFENRQSQIITIKFKISKSSTRITYFLINYILALLLVLPFYLDDSDQLVLRKTVLEKTPCPTIDFYNPNTLVLISNGNFLTFLATITGLSLIIFQSLFFLIPTTYHLFHVNKNFSKATRSLQRKFLGCVSVQLLIPWTALCTPLLYIIYSDKTSFYNQAYNNNAMLAMSTHGLFSSTCTLLIYKPYREFVKELIGGKSKVSPSVDLQVIT